MTKQELEAIKARADAATPGPWDFVHVYYGEDTILCVHENGTTTAIANAHTVDGEFNGEINAEFIAHARADIPTLVAEVERQTAYIARLEARLRDLLEFDWKVRECTPGHSTKRKKQEYVEAEMAKLKNERA